MGMSCVKQEQPTNLPLTNIRFLSSSMTKVLNYLHLIHSIRFNELKSNAPNSLKVSPIISTTHVEYKKETVNFLMGYMTLPSGILPQVSTSTQNITLMG